MRFCVLFLSLILTNSAFATAKVSLILMTQPNPALLQATNEDKLSSASQPKLVLQYENVESDKKYSMSYCSYSLSEKRDFEKRFGTLVKKSRTSGRDQNYSSELTSVSTTVTARLDENIEFLLGLALTDGSPMESLKDVNGNIDLENLKSIPETKEKAEQLETAIFSLCGFVKK